MMRLLSVHSLWRTDINHRHILSDWVHLEFYSVARECACVGGGSILTQWRCVSGTRKSSFALARAKFEAAAVWRIGMAEHYSKSKLKRKKSCVEKQNPEVSCKDTASTGRPTLSSGDMTADSGGWVCSSQRCRAVYGSKLALETLNVVSRAVSVCSKADRSSSTIATLTCSSCSSAPGQNKHSITEDVF